MATCFPNGFKFVWLGVKKFKRVMNVTIETTFVIKKGFVDFDVGLIY